MSYELNRKIKDLTPYEPLKGEYAVRLDANESFFPLEGKMLECVEKALSAVAVNRYPDPLAKEVRKAFAEYYNLRPECVTAGNGSDELISVLMSAFLMKGETVVTLEPDFSMYRFYASVSETNCVSIPKGASLEIDVDHVISVCRETKARLLIFSNPCNPTSLGLCREKVRKLIRSVEALVVLDEAYMDFWDQSLLSEAEDYENLIILRTCSKAIGSAALRLGFAVGNEKLTKALQAVKSPYNVGTFSQAMGKGILSCREELREKAKQIVASRKELEEALVYLEAENKGKFEVLPSCTNFVLLRSKEAALVYKALLERSIAVRCFEGFLRITAGSKEENAALLKALSEILAGN